jgi:hypothetical protein
MVLFCIVQSIQYTMQPLLPFRQVVVVQCSTWLQRGTVYCTLLYCIVARCSTCVLYCAMVSVENHNSLLLYCILCCCTTPLAIVQHCGAQRAGPQSCAMLRCIALFRKPTTSAQLHIIAGLVSSLFLFALQYGSQHVLCNAYAYAAYVCVVNLCAMVCTQYSIVTDSTVACAIPPRLPFSTTQRNSPHSRPLQHCTALCSRIVRCCMWYCICLHSSVSMATHTISANHALSQHFSSSAVPKVFHHFPSFPVLHSTLVPGQALADCSAVLVLYSTVCAVLYCGIARHSDSALHSAVSAILRAILRQKNFTAPVGAKGAGRCGHGEEERRTTPTRSFERRVCQFSGGIGQRVRPRVRGWL